MVLFVGFWGLLLSKKLSLILMVRLSSPVVFREVPWVILLGKKLEKRH